MYVLVIGGGIVGGGLVRQLMDNKHDVILIEQDKELCNTVYAETGVIAINGSGTSVDALTEAGIEKTDVVVATTGDDSVNLAVAVLAKSFRVPEIIVRMRNPGYRNAYKLAGATKIIRVTNWMVNQMMTFIENPTLRRITAIGGGKADIFAVVVPKGAQIAGKTIMDIAGIKDFPSQCVFVAVFNEKNEQFSIPRGPQTINEGDEIFMISTPADIKQVLKILTDKT